MVLNQSVVCTTFCLKHPTKHTSAVWSSHCTTLCIVYLNCTHLRILFSPLHFTSLFDPPFWVHAHTCAYAHICVEQNE